MKIRTLFTSFVLALALGPVAFAQGGPGGPGPGGPGGPGGAPAAPKTDLEKAMDKINEAAATPRNPAPLGAGGVGDVSDATKKDESLKRIAAIKEGANEALKLAPKYVPATITSDADKAKYVAEYQDTMKKFIAAIDALETAVKAGKTTETIALWDAANKIHNDAHGVYRAPRGGRGGPGGPGGGGPGGPGGAGMGAPGGMAPKAP